MLDVAVEDSRPVVERVAIERNTRAGFVTAGDLARVELGPLLDLVASDTRTVVWQGSELPVSGYVAAAIAAYCGGARK